MNMNRKLTDDAQLERDDFDTSFSRFQGCTCLISPPCSWCVHPGNPHNQEEDDDCWIDDDAAQSALELLEAMKP